MWGAVAAVTSCAGTRRVEVVRFPDIPDRHGVAGAFAGVVDGRLPVPNGYGVSLTTPTTPTTPEGVRVIGGGDAERHFMEVWTMRLEAGRVTFRALPPLPGVRTPGVVLFRPGAAR